jgi:MSHA biogenesis protein MshO
MAFEAMNRRRLLENTRQHGVTLVELVVVLTLLGVMASIGATLVSRIVAGQQDNRGRLVLAQAADSALARLSNELEGALPNSLRVTVNAAGTWIEWVPVRDGGRYRQAPDTASGTPGDVLDLGNAADNGFDVIGTALATPGADAQLVFANLGTPEADAYAGSSRRGGLAVSNGGRHVDFTATGALPADSGNARFFIVGTPVTLACRLGSDNTLQLQRVSGYGWRAAQPVSSTDLAGASATVVLLNNLAGCSAAYGSALANIGLLNLRLSLGDGVSAARMDFMQQLAVDNTP